MNKIITPNIPSTTALSLLFMSYFTLKTKNQRKHLLVKEIKRKIAPKLFASTTDSWKHATVSVKTLFDEALLVPVLFSCGNKNRHLRKGEAAVFSHYLLLYSKYRTSLSYQTPFISQPPYQHA